MSRIGNSPISIPAGVEVKIEGCRVDVNGPKGTLTLNVDPAIKVSMEKGFINLRRKNNQKRIRSLHGLSRNLIANMISGTTTLWTKDLELVGVGFRAQLAGNKLVLNVGYSHPVEITAPDNITFEVSDNTKIKVSGADKALVGQIAANIKKVRVPDVYKGKGIRYSGEYIRKKAGKSAKVGAAGTGGAGK